MGEFIAVTAVRTGDVGAVGSAVVRLARDHGVEADVLRDEPADPAGAAVVHAAEGAFTVVSWPAGVRAADVGGWLSRELDSQVSAVDVEIGASWQHVAFVKGEDRDRFSSRPGQGWVGDAVLLADLFDRPATGIAPYLVTADRAAGFAFPADEFELDDVWVFVDFWKRLGISYPDPGIPVRWVRLRGDLGGLPGLRPPAG
jgi:hypothetical protein